MFLGDLHIHSRYSRATSQDCDAQHLDFWAKRKGIQLIGTGDFTHPAWRRELCEALVPAEEGLYILRNDLQLPCRTAGEQITPRFVISGEISTIYKRGGKTRKVHHVILLPGLDEAEALSNRLEAIGNLHSDGRPILGLDSRDLLEITLECCPNAIYIPAHIWTPHFSVFGAFSDFESLEECYGDLTGHIHALETGLSSDPPMNRRLSMLDRYTLVSNSDAHSPAKLGREVNMLSCELGYSAIKHAIETGDGFEGTIEFYPEEGKYHLDGHRNCRCCLKPSETLELNGICPICGRKLTVGVLHRVEALADRVSPTELPKPFESLMPLTELISACMGVSPASKKVQSAYEALLSSLGSEFHILREISLETAEKAAGFAFAEGLKRLRAGRVLCKAGFDGEYGVISLFEPRELEMLAGQTSLIGLAGAQSAPLVPPAAPRKRAQIATDAPEIASATLNPEQEAASHADEATVAVIAGPGTGKTKTLIARIAWLIEAQNVPPSQITAVTFTRQAAGELQKRLIALLGKRAARGLTVGTFHAICMSLLDQKPIINHSQALDIVATLLAEHEEKLSPPECLRLLSLYKNALCNRTPSCCALPAWLPDAYQQRLHVLGLRDLDDVLLDALQLSPKSAFRYLLVDEFQDINAVQLELVKHWGKNARSLFVIGDPDQAIYGFRGADAACFDRLFAARPGTRVITLRENYRSTPQVLRCALSVIAHNPGENRPLRANLPDGASVRLIEAPDGFSQGVWIAKEINRMTGGVDMLDAQAVGNVRAVTRSFSDIAILCRTRRQLEQIENCLIHDSIPCVISGRDLFLEDTAVQGMIGFFASLLNPSASPSLRAALKGLWRLPDPLCQRASVALAHSAGGEGVPNVVLLEEELVGFDLLTPWVAAAKTLLPRLHKEKPRKLLEALAGLTGIDGKAIRDLFNTSVFHIDISSFVDILLSGEDADIRRASGAGYASGAVRLMTLHAAKGMEFPVVFLAGITSGSLPLERATEAVNPEEERRLFFVGITRAKDELILSSGGAPSSFLDELPAEVEKHSARPRNRMPRAEQLSLFD